MNDRIASIDSILLCCCRHRRHSVLAEELSELLLKVRVSQLLLACRCLSYSSGGPKDIRVECVITTAIRELDFVTFDVENSPSFFNAISQVRLPLEDNLRISLKRKRIMKATELAFKFFQFFTSFVVYLATAEERLIQRS